MGKVRKKSALRIEVTRIKFQHGIHDQVLNHLNKGQPILLPMPSPLPYIVVARDRTTVNGVKGRPPETSVAQLIGSFNQIEDIVALDEKGRDAARKHLTEERMTVLLPVAAWLVEESVSEMKYNIQASPEKFKQPSDTLRSEKLKCDLVRRPSAEFGNPYALFHHPVVTRNKQEFCSRENQLYASSGNIAGRPFQQSIDKIIEQFVMYATPDKSYHLLALDADHLRNDGFHGSTSMVRITERGRVKTTREGIQHHYAKTPDCWKMSKGDLREWERCLEKPKAAATRRVNRRMRKLDDDEISC